MKNKDIIGVLLFGCIFVMALSFQSCDKQEVKAYSSGHYLFFERWKKIDGADIRIDTVGYSFSHYVGETELVHDFQIKLVGELLTEDAEYRVVVVDSLTTALPEQYSIPEHPVFHKGQDNDVFSVVLYKKPSLEGKEVRLVLRLVANENFKLGYVTYTDVKIRFNDMKVRPLWWTKEVEDAYLGTYSYKKLETIIAANEGFTSFEGLSDTERRKVALNTKAYIELHGITEDDDDDDDSNNPPMIIPMY